MSKLPVDGDQIEVYANAIFRYASDIIVSMRTFPEHGIGPPIVRCVPINGAGLDFMVQEAVRQAQGAADYDQPQVSARLWLGL